MNITYKIIDTTLTFYENIDKITKEDLHELKKGKYTDWALMEELEPITAVIIPNGVVEIGESAFMYMKNLSKVVIPDSVEKIDKHAFSHCSKLESIKIPDSVNEIGDRAFFDCISLKEIILPKNLIRVEYGVFENCCKLSSIILPDKIDAIAAAAFNDCFNLTEITIPSNVQHIESNAFSNCPLEDVFIMGKETEIEPYVFNFGNGLVLHCPRKSMCAQYAKDFQIPCRYTDVAKQIER